MSALGPGGRVDQHVVAVELGLEPGRHIAAQLDAVEHRGPLERRIADVGPAPGHARRPHCQRGGGDVAQPEGCGTERAEQRPVGIAAAEFETGGGEPGAGFEAEERARGEPGEIARKVEVDLGPGAAGGIGRQPQFAVEQWNVGEAPRSRDTRQAMPVASALPALQLLARGFPREPFLEGEGHAGLERNGLRPQVRRQREREEIGEAVGPEIELAVEGRGIVGRELAGLPRDGERAVAQVERHGARRIEHPAGGIAPAVTHRHRKIEEPRDLAQREVGDTAPVVGDDRPAELAARGGQLEDQLVIVGKAGERRARGRDPGGLRAGRRPWRGRRRRAGGGGGRSLCPLGGRGLGRAGRRRCGAWLRVRPRHGAGRLHGRPKVGGLPRRHRPRCRASRAVRGGRGCRRRERWRW